MNTEKVAEDIATIINNATATGTYDGLRNCITSMASVCSYLLGYIEGMQGSEKDD